MKDLNNTTENTSNTAYDDASDITLCSDDSHDDASGIFSSPDSLYDDASLITSRRISSGLLWKLLELAGTQGIQFVVSIILARLLTPSEYGTISLITIFIAIANVFVQSGFATSLVQKKDVDDEDYSAALWVSLGLAVIMYLIILAVTPWIADFYETPILRQLFPLTAVILFPGAVVSIQTAYVSRSMQFRKLFISSLVAVIISGTVAVILALQGYGAWSMAWQQIIFYFALMITMFFTVSWKPGKAQLSRVNPLFAFGWKILVAGLIDTIWSNIYGLVIGKKFSQADLGGYNRAEQFPKIIAMNLSSAIQAVMLPAYSRVQEDKEALSSLLKKTICYSAFALFPMMAGIIAVAEPLVLVLLTDKWSFIVPYLRILCLCYALWPFHTANLQALNAQGRSDLFLKLEILKKISGIIFLLVSLKFFGIIGILLMKLANEFVCAILNAHYNRSLLDYGFLQQIRDVLPTAIISAIMCIVTTLAGNMLSNIISSAFILLVVLIAIGVGIYSLLTLLFNKKIVMELLNIRK